MAGCNHAPQEEDPCGESTWAPDVTWVLAWEDNFDGPAGSAPDPTNWGVVTTANPPNGELEYYTARRDNSFLDGDGHLVLRAIQESYMGRMYTSGRLDTRGLREQTYGKFEARIKIPAGRGFWPAYWLLGAGRWPASGEMDILEARGSQPMYVNSALHGPDFFGGGALTKTYLLPSGTFADDFHRFTLEWTADGIRWLIDDVPAHVETRCKIVTLRGKSWVYDANFHIILNLAVGGTYDGPPTSATPFPGDLVVDYMRVWRPGP